MFPSSGLFRRVCCPSAACRRPHCFYKHGGGRQLAGTGTGSSAERAGACGRDTLDSLRELERINKEIETMSHLVEEEKKRLTSYQNQRSTSGRSGAAGQGVPDGHSSDTPPAGRSKESTRKYVVDSSRPRTDLEYDPLSNFSSDLRWNSCGKLQTMKSNEGLKEAAAASGDQEPPVQAKTWGCHWPAPRCLESGEDPELVRDVTGPKARGQLQKADVSVGSKVKGSDVVPPLSQPHVAKSNEPSVSTNDRKCALETFQNKGGMKILEPLEVKTVDNNPRSEFIPRHLHNNLQCEPNLPPKTSFIRPAANHQRRRSSDGVDEQRPAEDQDCSSGSGSPKQSSHVSGPIQNTDSICHLSPTGLAEQPSTSCHAPTSLKSVVPCLTQRDEMEAVDEQLLMKTSDVIKISSDEELEYSDSDPMEECYKIFMEANHEDQGTEDHENQGTEDTSSSDVKVLEPESSITSHTQPARRRVAPPTQLLEKSRPQPGLLVPVGSYSCRTPRVQQTSRVQQGQQRVTVKKGQNKVEGQNPAVPSTLTLQTIPAQHASLSRLPVGRTIINVGSNLHLFLQDGALALPVDSCSGAVSSALTPISPVLSSSYAVNNVYLSSEGISLQRNGSTAPVLIPASARRPSASCSSCPSSKSTSVKRKLKHQSEDVKDKVPHDVRQRYVNLFTEEFLQSAASVGEAFGKALAEEKLVYNRSMNKVKYQSLAVNILKRLRSRGAPAAAQNEKKVDLQKLKGNIPLDLKIPPGNDDVELYECLKGYILTDEELMESNYPLSHPQKPGRAVLLNNRKVSVDPLKRICCRCGATYSVSQSGKHVRREECTYHHGRGRTHKVPGGVETRYSCCEGVMGAPGCHVSELHVHDFLSLEGFVPLPDSSSHTSCPGVFSLDCEMCYTVDGMEVSRVTVVNSDLHVVYDTFVRPENTVISLNSRFSGISEEDMKGEHPSLKEVQDTLRSFLSADSVLIGHGLETDLCLLKLIHGKIVDTSHVFPHRLGPPHTLSLKKIMADHLRKIIQQSVGGHDTQEEACACMELMLWKVREDGKMKKGV